MSALRATKFPDTGIADGCAVGAEEGARGRCLDFQKFDIFREGTAPCYNDYKR